MQDSKALELIDNSNCRQKSTINTNFDHCRYMLDSEMNICYISTIKHGKKEVLGSSQQAAELNAEPLKRTVH
jgi:hypothetical protein